MARGVAILCAALLIAACSSEPDQPGGVTAAEAQQLNDAAAMLDANSVSPTALGNDMAQAR